MDAGHELRTPITTLRTNIELLERAELTPPDRAKTLASARAELEELTNLVGELVDLGTDTRRSDPPRACDLFDIADGVVQRARRRHQREIALAGESTLVVGQPLQLERAISNLVDNPVKFDPSGAAITLVVSEASVEVRDHGPGIAIEDLGHVFDRFYRATTSAPSPGRAWVWPSSRMWPTPMGVRHSLATSTAAVPSSVSRSNPAGWRRSRSDRAGLWRRFLDPGHQGGGP